MDTFARLHKAIDYLKDIGKIHIQRDIVAAIAGNESNVTQAIKGNPRYLTKPFLKRFAHAYSEYINEDWLLTGEGRMIKPDRDMRPHYDVTAAAGFMDGISEGRMSAEFRAMAIPLLNYDFSIDAKGDSMMPRIENSDTLLCHKMNDRFNLPIGDIYVLDTKDGFAVKVLQSINDETVTLHSLNPAYPDYEIDFDSILGIAKVVGLIRGL